MDLMKRIKKARFMRPTGYPPVYIYIEGRAGFSYLACASVVVVGICKVHRGCFSVLIYDDGAPHVAGGGETKKSVLDALLETSSAVDEVPTKVSLRVRGVAEVGADPTN